MGQSIQKPYPQYKPLPQEKVLELAKKYKNIKHIDYLCPNTIKIQTILDTFFCEIKDKYLLLKHQSSNKRKVHVHTQRVFYDYFYLFDSLRRHDTYKLTKRGTCKIQHLYERIGK